MKKLTERDCVNALVRALRKNSPNAYVFVDRDPGITRHTRSGWDFLIAYGGCVIFFEAKTGTGGLTDWQKLTRADIERAGCRYVVIRFSDDDKSFVCSHLDGVHKIASAKVEKFFARKKC